MERTYSGDHLLTSIGGSASAGGDISDAIEAITTVPRRMAPQPSVSLVISILPGSSHFALQRGRRFGRLIAGYGTLASMYPCNGLIRFQITACLSTRLDHTLFPETVHCWRKSCVTSANTHHRGAVRGRNEHFQSQATRGD